MSDRFIPRALESHLRKAAAQFPAVVLTGPRQSGKTTLLNHACGVSTPSVSLAPPDNRAAAAADPRGFLALHTAPVIFDEVQYAPELLPYIKERIDDTRSLRGQFLLTGSQNLLLAEQVNESLAGRAAILRLLPLSHRESSGRPPHRFPWELQRLPSTTPEDPRSLWESILRGGYPELAAEPGRDVPLWFSSYVQTYLERDVRNLRLIGDLASFQSFLRALAARTGQLLNLADLARDLGVAVNTAKAWLSVLEATYQVIVLRPYHASLNKRLVKTPKVYFTDTGTLCHLVGLKHPEHAASGPLGGVLFETAVLLEIYKSFLNRGEEPRIHFWRTSAGVEVDFIVAAGETLVPVEVKLSSTPRPAMANSIRSFQQDLGAKAGHGYVVHPGHTCLPMGPNATSLPFSAI